MFGIEKDFQKLMEQVYGPHYGLGRKVEEESARIAKQLVDNAVEEAKKMDEPVKYETPMTAIEDIEAQIKVLQSKLEFYKELERTKTPCEIAYKRVYGNYPVTDIADTCWSGSTWTDFATGYNAAQKDYKVGEYQEPVPEEEHKTLYDILRELDKPMFTDDVCSAVKRWMFQYDCDYATCEEYLEGYQECQTVLEERIK